MGTAQQAMLGQLVDVAANGLRSDGERLGQFVDADVAAFTGKVENVVLARSEVHERFLWWSLIIGCGGDGFEPVTVRLLSLRFHIRT